MTLFLAGASGNITVVDPCAGGASKSKEEVGLKLAEDASKVIAAMQFRDAMKLGCRTRTIKLPFRQATDDEVKGKVRGAQRFIDPAIYDRGMPRVLERIKRMGQQPAEVQVLFMDEYAYVGIPAEYFVEHGLRMKEQCYPRRVLVAAQANGMVGYVPLKEAFLRGGYETTFFDSSRLAPEAGDMLADCATELVRTGI
jgi:hypothetical protein